MALNYGVKLLGFGLLGHLETLPFTHVFFAVGHVAIAGVKFRIACSSIGVSFRVACSPKKAPNKLKFSGATSLGLFVFVDCPSPPHVCRHLFFVPCVSATELHINTRMCVLNSWSVSLSLCILRFCVRLLVLIGKVGWGERERKEDKDYGGMRWNWGHLHMENKTRNCGK